MTVTITRGLRWTSVEYMGNVRHFNQHGHYATAESHAEIIALTNGATVVRKEQW